MAEVRRVMLHIQFATYISYIRKFFTYVSCIYYLLPVNAISVEHFRVGLKSYFSTSKKSLQNIPPHVNVKYVQHNYKKMCVFITGCFIFNEQTKTFWFLEKL